MLFSSENNFQETPTPKIFSQKDIWCILLDKLECFRDYRNAALVCKTSARAAYQIKWKKAIEFSNEQLQYKDFLLYKRYYFLPNSQLHGLYETYNWIGDYCVINRQQFSFGKKIEDSKPELEDVIFMDLSD